MKSFILTYCTTPSMEVSKKIARELLNNKLCACVNIIPKVTSMYLWENEVKEDEEHLLIIKSKWSLEKELMECIQKIHPYEVCEVISTKVERGNEEYLKWIEDVTK
jgi:periplasmic divalent cation tolerance protein